MIIGRWVMACSGKSALLSAASSSGAYQIGSGSK